MSKHMKCNCRNCQAAKFAASASRKKFFKNEQNRRLRRVINRTTAWENPIEVISASDLWA